MTKHGWLVLGMAWTMAGCAETAASSSPADAASAVDASADVATVVDAEPPADAASGVDVGPAIVDAPDPVDVPDAGPACAARAMDVNAYATRSGGYSLRATSGARSGVGPCQTWQGGGDRWMRFTAPVAGLWRVSAQGSNLWSFSAHRACEGAGTEVACRQFTDFHSSNPFTQPLSFDLELAAGESTFLLASGCSSTGCAWTVDIAPPITAEGRCSLSAPASACRDGWFCRDGAGLPSGVGVCVEATAPALDAASAFAWDDTVRLRVEGSDTSRDTSRAEVEVLGADDAPITTTTAYLSRDEGDRIVGRAVVYVGPRVAAVTQALRVTLIDARGLRSETRRVALSPPVIAGPAQPCDEHGVDNVCPARHRCTTAEWGGLGCVAAP